MATANSKETIGLDWQKKNNFAYADPRFFVQFFLAVVA